MHRLSQRFLPVLMALGLILGTCRGYLALYEEDQDEPRLVYPCRVETLPPSDQAALAEGIPVRSEKELAHLLEDFLS